jgi:putative hemolysin
MIALEVALVLVLVVVNGYLAMSELAVVSARRSRLQRLATAGHRGASTALTLAENPGRFLSTVQIGITLVGVLAGAFSGATLAERLADYLEGHGLVTGVADALAVAVVVAAITYLSLIVGELVPKQLALRNAERVAASVARPMMQLARWAAPAVWLLDASSRLLLGLFGSKASDAPRVTEEEIRSLIAEAESAGIVEPEEKRMIAGVMRLGDRAAKSVMTPRHDVDWVDLDEDDAVIRSKIRSSTHSRLPAGHGSVDEIIGVVQAKDLLDTWLDGRMADPKAVVREAPVVTEMADALEVIEVLRKSPVDMAIVVDEYGTFQGIVTLANILEAIAGEFAGSGQPSAPRAVRRDDGSWLLDGAMHCDEAGEFLGTTLPTGDSFHTLAGFVLSLFKRVPKVGESVEWKGWRFEVIDLDGRRIDKVLASRAPTLHRTAVAVGSLPSSRTK